MQISCTEIVPEVSYSLEVDPNTKMVVVAGTESSIQVRFGDQDLADCA